MWYSSPERFDITGISAGIVQTPNCSYGYVYSAYWLPTGYTSPIKLPANEITFENKVFTIQKCNPLGINTNDIECNDGTMPRDKLFNLVFKVTLDDINLGTVNEVFATKPFGAKIYDACTRDEVSFSPSSMISITNPPYSIENPLPISVVVDWSIYQNFYLCPLTCSIDQDGKNIIPDFITGFNPTQNSPYANPSIKEDFLSISIKTGNTAYDGSYYKFNIWCVSTTSTLPSGKAKT